jgi:hypothetical protein
VQGAPRSGLACAALLPAVHICLDKTRHVDMPAGSQASDEQLTAGLTAWLGAPVLGDLQVLLQSAAQLCMHAYRSDCCRCAVDFMLSVDLTC